MKRSKQRRLTGAGWRVGSAADMLGLEPAEAAYIELKVRLATELMTRRQELQLSQKEAALQVHSSQSRVARMEGADPSVSLDLIIRALLALKASQKPIRAALEQAIS
jgi:predicted XRE-type DNA-binding protein